MAQTLDQKIADLDAKRARLMERRKKQDTRQKIIVGAIIIAEAERSPEAARKLLGLIDTKVTRDVDRKALAPVIETLGKVAGNG